MHFPSILTFVLFIPSLVQGQIGLFVDKSCTDRPEWDGAFKLALNNAKRAYERLGSPTDTDFYRAVETLFKVDFNNQQAINFIRRKVSLTVFHHIALETESDYEQTGMDS